MRRALPALAALLVLSVLGACGIPTDEKASTSGPGDVPFGLLEPDPAPSPTTALPSSGPVAQVYLLDDDGQRLVAVARPGAGATLPDLLAALGEGPTDSEARRGLTTALPDAEVVASVELSGGVAAVDLAPAFGELAGADQRRAIAQIVFTLTGRPGIGRVSITLDGHAVEFPRGDGSLTSGSVSRDAYQEFAESP